MKFKEITCMFLLAMTVVTGSDKLNAGVMEENKGPVNYNVSAGVTEDAINNALHISSVDFSGGVTRHLLSTVIKPVETVEIKENEVDIVAEPEVEECKYDNIEMLEYCVEAESGDQSLYGRKLVCDVILNQVDSDNYPNTVYGVITAKYHFSTYWDGAMKRAERRGVSELTKQAVREELEHRTVDDIYLFRTDYYHSFGTPWKKVGDHYFSKE